MILPQPNGDDNPDSILADYRDMAGVNELSGGTNLHNAYAISNNE